MDTGASSCMGDPGFVQIPPEVMVQVLQRHFTPVHEKLAHFDLVVGGLVPVTLVLTFVGIAFAVTFSGGTFPDDTYELANALVGAIPSLSIQIGFYIGVLAITVSTMRARSPRSRSAAPSENRSTRIPRFGSSE